MQGPAGLTAALIVCLNSLVRLHSEDVVLSHEVWDSVMKGCFCLSQRKALEYLNTGRAGPAETLSCSFPMCSAVCSCLPAGLCELCLPRCCVRACAPGTLVP